MLCCDMLTTEPAWKTNTHALGRGFILLAALLWSTSGFFAKAPFFASWALNDRAVMLGFWRAAFAGLALLPLARRPAWKFRLLPAMFAFAVMNGTFLLAMTNTTAANAIWLQYTAPAWVLLFGWGLTRETIHRRDVALVVTSTLGVFVILACEWTWGGARHDQAGTLWGLCSGVAFAGVIVSLGRVGDLDTFWVISLCHLSAAFALLPWMVTRHLWPSGPALAWLAAFGLLQMAAPYVLFSWGLKYVPPQEAACLALLEPLLVPLWVWLVWRAAPGYQPPAWWTLVGAAFILVGLVDRYWRRGVER